MSAKWLYRALLRLYPEDYAATFASEMMAAFEKGWEEHSRRFPSLLRFASMEFAGLIAGAATEWMAKLTTNRSVRDRNLSELRFAGPAAAAPSSLPLDLAQAQQRVTLLVERIVHAIANHDFESARRYSYEEHRERENLTVLKRKYGM